MAVAKRPRASAGANRGSAPANPCCPYPSDLVVLAMADPMSTGGTTRGLRRIRSDGTSINSEYVEPYGHVIPKGKCLVVTDLSYYSGFTQTMSLGSLTKLVLGGVKVLELGLAAKYCVCHQPEVRKKQRPDRRQRHHGNGVRRSSRSLSVHGRPGATELFVYGYLKPL